MSHNPPFEQLIKQFARLPGLGPRSAKRIALHLLTEGRDNMSTFASIMQETAANIKVCSMCGNLDACNPCQICNDPKRDKQLLCIVAHISDLWAIERTSVFNGHYHVLGGVLSALDGKGPEDLNFAGLKEKLTSGNAQEIILALGATVEGQSTAHYIADMALNHHNHLKITRLAHGMPVGGELDYLDDGTIMTALKSRHAVS